MFYIDINGGFKDSVENKELIIDSDVAISDDIYNKYIELQSQSKTFKLKDIHGITFEDIFEEVVQVFNRQIPLDSDRLTAIESAISALMGV